MAKQGQLSAGQKQSADSKTVAERWFHLFDILSRMTTAEVANRYVALCREGKYLEALEELYADDIISVEPMELGDLPRELHGKKAVRDKNVWWFDVNELHNGMVTGPFLSPDRFSVIFSLDWTVKSTGERRHFDEIAVYTVSDGKIVREEFLYGS
jgi:hypothetical protein